jgi:hypothetical protein
MDIQVFWLDNELESSGYVLLEGYFHGEETDQRIDNNATISEALPDHGETCGFIFSPLVILLPSKRGSISAHLAIVL